MSDKEMLFCAQAYRTLTKATAEISNNSEDQKRFEIIDWLVKQAEKTQKYREVLNNIYELAEYDEYDNTLEQIVSEIKKALEGTE